MKRVTIHVVLILTVGVGIGLILRGTGTLAPDAPQLTTAGPAGYSSGSQQAATKIEGEEWLSKFTLTERSGKEVSSASLKGKPYVVSFFFSTCPASCVTQNQKLRELQAEFEGQGVHFLSISVDPETDSPEVLSQYARRFNADQEQWLFLTGDLNYIRRVGAEIYKLPVNKKFHTDKFVLVDREGKISGYYDWPQPRQFEQLKQDIREQLETTEGQGESQA